MRKATPFHPPGGLSASVHGVQPQQQEGAHRLLLGVA